MAYSSIKKKKCSCSPNCQSWPTLGCGGKNYNHLSDEEKKEKGTRASVARKNKTRRTNLSAKLHTAQKEASKEEIDLKWWFTVKMKTSKRQCENCGQYLHNLNDNDWRGSQHHIIDKSKINGCPSVASNPHNHMVLGRWCCHPQWHTSYDNASKMPCFIEAKRRFELFKNDIAENEKRKIPAVFLNPSLPSY